MVFDLPEVAPYRLKRAPLVQAVAQVRYPLIAHLSTLPGITSVQESLRDRLPYMSPHHSQMTVQMGSGVSVVDPGAPDGWDLRDDSGHTLWISPGIANLTADENYDGVESFIDLFEQSISAVSEIEGLRRCDRLGVRYLSVATPPLGDEKAWSRWFKPEVCGWPPNMVTGRLDTTLTRTQVTASTEGGFAGFPSEPQALITHGYIPSGTLLTGFPPIALAQNSFILDFDLFVASPQPFVVDALVSQFKALHSQMDRFFRWTLTEEGAEFFELEEK